MNTSQSDSDSSQSFVQLVGSYISHSFEHDHGIHIVINISGAGKTYPVDVNIQSNDGTSVDYCVRSEQLIWGFPYSDGINTPASLSYVGDLHLDDSDFQLGNEAFLSQLLSKMASTANKIVVYGMMYTDSESQGLTSGLHDIHYNQPHQDGCIGFTTLDGAQKRILWVYFKFQSQHLPVDNDPNYTDDES